MLLAGILAGGMGDWTGYFDQTPDCSRRFSNSCRSVDLGSGWIARPYFQG